MAEAEEDAEPVMPQTTDGVGISRLERDAPVGEVPEWLGGITARAAPRNQDIAREPSGQLESAADLPDWLAGLDGERQRPSGSSEPEPPAAGIPEWLQSASEDAAPAADVERGKWHPAATPEIAKELEDTVGAIAGRSPPEMKPMPAQAAPVSPGPNRAVAEPLPGKTRPASASSTISAPSLGGAQSELGRGNIAAALDMYGRLIRKGRSLEEIIRDLRDALYRYPVEVPIWQALGDAYMRANRLQEALDAYTKAEELLR
jgi:hypothetical protein